MRYPGPDTDGRGVPRRHRPPPPGLGLLLDLRRQHPGRHARERRRPGRRRRDRHPGKVRLEGRGDGRRHGGRDGRAERPRRLRGNGVKGPGLGIRAAQGAIGSALSQGVGVLTGLQSKFDWAGVAASAAGAFAGGAMDRATSSFGNSFGAQVGSTFLGASADGIASATARSLITGTNFGDNLIAVLPGVIGRTIGAGITAALGKSVSAPESNESSTKAPDIVVASGTPDPEEAKTEAIVVQGQRAGEALPPGVTRQDIETWNQYDVVNERLQLLEAEENLQRERAVLSPQKLARREARISRMRDRVTNLNRIDTALQEGVIGRTMMLGKNNQTEYVIRGPGYTFNTKQDAAKDGIAMSFMIARITGDSYERGARIDIGEDGKYTYFRLQTGARAARDFYINGVQIVKGTLTINITSTQSTRAYFHTHPNATGMGEGDADFSPSDIAAYEGRDRPRRGRPEPPMRRRLDAFLGGNDGSFDMLTPQLRNGRVVGYTREDLAGDRYFKVPRTRALPTGMRGEPE